MLSCESPRATSSDSFTSPPAVTASRLYLTSSFGDLFVLDRATGEELWALNVDAPILSQPAVAGGKVFLGTADGSLYAFEADDPDPCGWPMWGGGPGHNGAVPQREGNPPETSGKSRLAGILGKVVQLVR